MRVSPLGGDHENDAGGGDADAERTLQTDAFPQEHCADDCGERGGKGKADLGGAQSDAQGSGIKACVAHQNAGKTGSGGQPEKMGRGQKRHAGKQADGSESGGGDGLAQKHHALNADTAGNGGMDDACSSPGKGGAQCEKNAESVLPCMVKVRFAAGRSARRGGA